MPFTLLLKGCTKGHDYRHPLVFEACPILADRTWISPRFVTSWRLYLHRHLHILRLTWIYEVHRLLFIK
jgi:hypothetical protein